ncbi:transcriptional regulator CtsR [Sphingomonas sp. UYAg733]
MAVATEVLGKPVETFLSSRDGGRDGAFVGVSDGSRSTIQCKFTSRPDATLGAGDLTAELSKVQSLASRGLADDYVILTNHGVSGVAAAEIEARFKAAGAGTVRTFGRDWITAQIRERPRLRMMVPRVYGLGDLSQIIDERAYLQAQYILSAMGDDLRCFVTTDSHRRSIEALTRHGFVLLLGDPASGKSTIGATLAVGALDDGCGRTVRVTSAEEFKRHWNPNEPDQFFWVDDAFGPTQYLQSRVDGWNQELLMLRAAIKAGARILFTSRTHIWESARPNLKISQFPLLGRSQVIINVHGLSDDERAQILYNHLKMGDQPPETRTILKPLLAAAAANAGFLPETARRLGSTIFTNTLRLDQAGVIEFIEKPEPFLREVLENLDDHSRAAMALIFLHGQAGQPSPLEPSVASETVERLLGVNLPSIGRALEAMNNSLTLLVQQEDGPRWIYKHPTISDAFATLVGESPELIELYVGGAKIERLLDEVICGAIEIQGASVRVPSKLYSSVRTRIAESRSDWFVRRFLAKRCDGPFLRTHLDQEPTLVAALIKAIGSTMAYDANTDLLARLNEVGMLDEADRLTAANKIAELTIDVVDSSVFRDTNLASILTKQEVEALSERFQAEIVGNLDEVIRSWEEDWSVEDERAHFEDLKTSLERYVMYSAGEDHSIVQAGIERVDAKITELEEQEDEPVERHASPVSPVSPSLAQLATIFDDVDE